MRAPERPEGGRSGWERKKNRMRQIDADALMPKLKFIQEAEHQIYGKGSYGFASKCITAIEDAPTIEERKKGKWIRMSDADGDYYCCSQCGEELPRYMTEIPSWDRPYPHKKSIDKTDFCPNCGSDMRGKKE